MLHSPHVTRTTTGSLRPKFVDGEEDGSGEEDQKNSNDSSQHTRVVQLEERRHHNFLERSLSSVGSISYPTCDPTVFASFSTLIASLFPSPAVHDAMTEEQKLALAHFHSTMGKIVLTPPQEMSRMTQATLIGELLLTTAELFPQMVAAVQGMTRRPTSNMFIPKATQSAASAGLHANAGSGLNPMMPFASPAKSGATQLLQTSLSELLAARIARTKPEGKTFGPADIEATTPSKTLLPEANGHGLSTPSTGHRRKAPSHKAAGDDSALAFLAMAASNME